MDVPNSNTMQGVSVNNATTSRKVLLMVTRPEKPLAFSKTVRGKTVVMGFVKDLMEMLGDILNTDVQIQLMPEGPQDTQTTDMLTRLKQEKAVVKKPEEAVIVETPAETTNV